MPVEKEQHGYEACDGILYAVAGANASAAINTVYAYNPATNAWSIKTVLPVSVQSPVLRSVGGKLYLIGGQTAQDYTKIPDVYEYDPAGNSWTQKTNMPTAREDMGSAVIGTKIYVFGGLTNGPGNGVPVKVLEIYDTANDTWDATKADMPDYKHLGDFGAAYNGKVYAVAGTNTMTGYPNLTPVGAVYEYDPVGDTWATKAAMPAPTCYKECAVVGTKLYVVCGATTVTTTYTGAVHSYDFAADEWAFVGFAPYAARGIGLAVYNNEIYMSGGWITAAVTNHYKLTLA